MVRAMAFNNMKNTMPPGTAESPETTDTTTAENEQTGRIEPEDWQEPSARPADAEAPTEADADADVYDRAEDEEPGTPVAVTGTEAEGTGSRGFGAGAVAIVSAGLGLSSLTGTPLSEMMRNRQEIIGQIETSAGGGGDQVEALYGAPWHTAAIMNGVVALVAVLLGGALLVGLAQQSDSRQWVRAVALGGVVLGAIGLVVAGGMYLDIFGPQPELPPAPAPPG